MNKKSFSQKYLFCFSVFENDKKSFLSKIKELYEEYDSLIELRIDYLLANDIDIKEIISYINEAKKHCPQAKFLLTLRTINDGGKVDLSIERYFYCIKELYMKAKSLIIDIEYKYYINYKLQFDTLINKNKKEIILSAHFFDKILFEDEYIDLIKNMIDSPVNYIKIATKVFCKQDLFTFMNTAKNSYKIIKKSSKMPIFIAMGDIGKLSRVWPEFTNTKIVFLSNYNDLDSEIGQINYNTFYYFNNLLEKNLKNW